ncbi:hypothetical protein BGW38_001525 [Lunasporangiospora selenospora]|uniref:Uncharacterized protein n=1 Tax=Lunasporangiospora selenospora TaxID=979761 RepID=A0A9P6G2I0_9FUNG|nr:hypothetical protein BGW38_001525 [Lunasporangiospora selenospora]
MEVVLEQLRESSAAHVQRLDQTSLHLLPCGIQHDGVANVPGFFFLVDGQYPPIDSSPHQLNSLQVSLESASISTGTSESVPALAPAPTTTTTCVESVATSDSNKTSSEQVSTSTLPPEVSFRGRTLKGTRVSFPSDYSGLIYKCFDNISQPIAHDPEHDDNGCDLGGNEDDEAAYQAMLSGMQEKRRTMKTVGQFNEFTLWSHDDQPTLRTDKVMKAMQWIDIANVLHGSDV